MRADKKPMQVIFRHAEKDQESTRVDEAFGLLFDEVFRLMNEKKPIMATK